MPSEILGCIEAGASGFTLSSYSVKEMIETIKIVHNGGASFRPDLLAQLSKRTDVQSFLTPRELEVLHLIGDGLSNKEIAQFMKGCATFALDKVIGMAAYQKKLVAQQKAIAENIEKNGYQPCIGLGCGVYPGMGHVLELGAKPALDSNKLFELKFKFD